MGPNKDALTDLLSHLENNDSNEQGANIPLSSNRPGGRFEAEDSDGEVVFLGFSD